MLNPEPMADFFDAFVIGEGEEIVLEIAAAYLAWRSAGESKLELLHSSHLFTGCTCRLSMRLTTMRTELFDLSSPFSTTSLKLSPNALSQNSSPTTDFIVPNVDIVHDRIAVEIMRGCTRGCRSVTLALLIDQFVKDRLRKFSMQSKKALMLPATKPSGCFRCPPPITQNP